MSKQNKVLESKKKSATSNGGIVDTELSSENKCRHCGGTFKLTPEGDVCMMCGRDKAHKCENCLHGEAEVAA